MNALAKIRTAGFIIELDGGHLAIEPFSKLTPAQTHYLKQHKADIIRELEQEAANNAPVSDDAFFADDRRHCHECQNLDWQGRCLASPTKYHPVDDIPQRCGGFSA